MGLPPIQGKASTSAAQDTAGVVSRPRGCVLRVPFARHCLERVFGVQADCPLLRLLRLARIDTGSQPFSSLVALPARSCERDLGVDAKRQQLLFAGGAVLEAPVALAGRRDEQKQAPAVE